MAIKRRTKKVEADAPEYGWQNGVLFEKSSGKYVMTGVLNLTAEFLEYLLDEIEDGNIQPDERSNSDLPTYGIPLTVREVEGKNGVFLSVSVFPPSPKEEKPAKRKRRPR